MKYNKKHLLLTTCIVLSLAACSPKKTADEYIQSAKSHVAEGKSSAAILELKNAVSIDLQNVESRYLLGSLYLDFGDVAAAEKELMRSLELNGSKDIILPKLFKALNLQDKSEKVLTLINQISPIPDKILPEILLYKTLAYLKLGDKPNAEDTIAQASEFSSESVYSQLGEAYLIAETIGRNEALGLIANILLKIPELTEALLLKGQLLFMENDFVNAIDVFNEYHRILPNNIQVRLFLANSYIRNNQHTDANEHLDFLLKIAPEHPFINQLKGLVFYQNGDYESALAHTDKAIQNGLNVPSNRIVAGLSAFKLEQYERAHYFLNTIADLLSSTHPVRRVLAVVQLQLGYSLEAGNTLQVMDGATADDINLLTTASFELLKAGKLQEAKALVAKTNDISISNPQDIAKLGILKLSLNDLEGITDLEKASDIDSALPIAKFALASAYIQNKEYDKALALAEEWKSTAPDNIEGYNLKAKILLGINEVDKAEKELNKVLDINEYNPYSLLYFAEKAFKAKAFDKSISIVDKLLSKHPNYLSGLKLKYKAYKAVGKVNIAISRIEESYKDNFDNTQYRILYSKVLFLEKSYKKVIELLDNINNDELIQPIHWLLLGDSYLQLGYNEEALDIFNRWLNVQPQYRMVWLRKISIQENMKNYSAALSTTNSALKLSTEDVHLKLLRAHFLILTRDFLQAQAQLDSMTKEQKELPLAEGLQAKIWLTEGEFEKAIPGLQSLYNQMENTYNASLLFATLRKVEKEEEAFSFIKQHFEKFPDDSIIQKLLAESAVKFDKNIAQQQYTKLLNNSPNDLSILNNLAWIEYELGNYQHANVLAERALVVNNRHPQVLDTVALIKLKVGEKEKAVEYWKLALELAPNDKEIAKHYQEAIE